MIKKILAIVLLFALFTLSSCNSSGEKSPENLDYVADIIGKWDLRRVNDYTHYTYHDYMVFKAAQTGCYYIEGEDEESQLTWSYDEKANVYLIYIDYYTGVGFVSISEENGIYIMHYGRSVGTKSE